MLKELAAIGTSVGNVFAGIGKPAHDPVRDGPGRRKGTRRPDGQKPGHFFGEPVDTYQRMHPSRRVKAETPAHMKWDRGWIDSNGHPHGLSGDKLARKALRGQITKRGKATRI